MRRLLSVALALALLLALLPQPAAATIHPLVASFCSKVVAMDLNLTPVDPVGQTPESFDPAEWDQSDLRALLATGVLTLTPTGPMLDLTHPAAQKWSAPFTLNANFPAFIHCPFVAGTP